MERLYINYERLNEGPLTKQNGLSENENSVLEIDEFKLLNLKNEITSELNTCYMVSGYRGSGKTSYINKLGNLVQEKDKNIIFINVNFGSGDEKTNILRKLIRSLANKFLFEIKDREKTSLIKKFLKKISFQDKKNNFNMNYSYLELLNRRTFEEVTNSQTGSIRIETNRKWSIDFTILLTIISGGLLYLINRDIPFGDEILKVIKFINDNKIDKLVVPVITIILPLLLFVRILKEKKEQNKLTFEYNTKTLYDDEIAELHLKEAIERLSRKYVGQDYSYKLVFVIDELDKLEDGEALKVLLGQLKPLMLEGIATFIIIAGQKLHYMYELEQLTEDSLLSNLFSKNIHVPLLEIEHFKLYVNNVLENQNVYLSVEGKSQDIYGKYIDSLILNSNRSLRTFVHLLKQNIEWDENTNKSYIPIRKNRIIMLQSQLLNIVQSVLEPNLLKDEDPSNDFFITQLHLVVKKMQQKQGKFKKQELYIEREGYPSWYWTTLSSLVDSLLFKMVEKDLLMCDVDSLSFNWKKEVEIFFNPELKVVSQSFIKEFEILNEIILGYHEEILENEGPSTFIDNYSDIKKEGLKIAESDDSVIVKLNNVYNFLTTGDRYYSISGIRRLLPLNNFQLIQKVLESYTELITRRALSNYNIIYEVESLDNSYADIIASSSNDNVDILIDVKYYKTINFHESRFNRIPRWSLPKKEKYEKEKGKKCKYIVMIYVDAYDSQEIINKVRERKHEDSQGISIILLNTFRNRDNIKLEQAILEVVSDDNVLTS
ncbi:KAP family P-loop domain protein [Priestia megaterium Q3]|uniref:KAP family P-loop domain protein n=1 Tax=Priestia megaterium Q3 TaxID=1452722 RepID=A0A806TK35_PRIMG|nr:P-loop NTPase fold protein [Priestia megaterium]AKP78632.1 KAP family P-loop domain protein [Priestia megaterium Q3]